MTGLDHSFLDRLEKYGPIARSLSMCLRPTFCAEHDDTTLVWGDWSAIEARVLPWLANNSGGNAVLDVFRQVDADPNAADIYMIEAGNIHGIDGREVNARIQDGDKEAKNWRQEGKVACIAEGQLVLTADGLAPIEEVRKNTRVWDGLQWVRHSGVVFKGMKDVYTYDGLTATADHIVWTDTGETARFSDCIVHGWRLARTSHGTTVRLATFDLQHDSARKTPSRAGLAEEKMLAHHSGKARTYDLVNAGPRNRFTVSGCLVHNCLSLGFGGGVGALMAMATNYSLHYDEVRAQRVVDIWRENNRWAMRFWDELKEAFFNAYENPGVIYPSGRVAYLHDADYHGGTTFCALPCGRLLSYPNLKYRDVQKTDSKTGEEYTTKALTYRKGYSWGSIWHGILAENATQASAASVLRAKLRHLDHATQAFWSGPATRGKPEIENGQHDWEMKNQSKMTIDRAAYERLYKSAAPDCPFDVRFHTHDEIGLECYEGDAAQVKSFLKGVMDAPLDWSDGLPLVSEITSHWNYTKSLD